MNKQFKDSINQSYSEAIKAMEERQSVKVVRLSLLECAARLEAVAKIEFAERTKLNALGYKLLGVVKKLGTNEMDIEKAYEFLTGQKLSGVKKAEKPIDIEDELAALAKSSKMRNTQIEDEKATQTESVKDDGVNDVKEELPKQGTSDMANVYFGRQDEENAFKENGVKSQRKGELRAATLSEYVGQEKIKPLLKEAIAAAKSRGEPLEHVLMFGSAGLGKTTLAKIIANEMGGECTVMNGATIKDVDDFIDVIKNVKRGDVVFIDEIHRMSQSAAEAIYKAMEDFELQFIQKTRGGDAKNVDMKLPPFTLIGATTHSGLLSKPMRDRFSLKFKLEPYTEDELIILATNSMRKLGFELGPGAAAEIAKRSRGVPRICNTYVKRIRDKAQVLGVQVASKELVESYFLSAGIDENGLDEADIAYLSTLLNKFGGAPVGIDTLCAALGEGRNIVEEQIEPYLIYLGFINVSSNGRDLTKAGEEYVKSYNKRKSVCDDGEILKDVNDDVALESENAIEEGDSSDMEGTDENDFNEESASDADDSNAEEIESDADDSDAEEIESDDAEEDGEGK